MAAPRIMQLVTFLSAVLVTATASARSGLVVDIAPDTPQPYVLPNLKGATVDFGGLIMRTLVPNATSSGALSVMGVNSGLVPLNVVHYHMQYEAFYTLKGGFQVFVNSKQGRELQANDFSLLAPGGNHTYRANELDFQLSLCMAPGGIDVFFKAASNLYNSSAPFDPQDHTQLNITKVLGLLPQFGSIPEPMNTNNMAWTNGTTEDGLDTWHVADQNLPASSTEPYFISSNRGPKFLRRSEGKVIAQLASGQQTKNTLSIATVVMKPCSRPAAIKFQVDQAIQVTEGQLHLEIDRETVQMIFGDLAFIPKGTLFSYWSTVGFTKFINWSAGSGLADSLIEGAEPWQYASWPAY